MQWRDKPDAYKIEHDSVFMTADHGTNLFHSPSSSRRDHKFPFYYEEIEGDFTIQCKVAPEFSCVADQGGIIIWENENKWIKLAFELTDNRYPTIVSIVNNEISDDCNGSKAESPVWLCACRKGDTFALHYSEDGVKWNLVRIFRFEMNKRLQVGVSAQCPSGKKCGVLFEKINISPNKYRNIRNINSIQER